MQAWALYHTRQGCSTPAFAPSILLLAMSVILREPQDGGGLASFALLPMLGWH